MNSVVKFSGNYEKERTPDYVKPKIYRTTDHDIDPSHIDPDALYIIDKLRLGGYNAYLVGGSVRDLLKGEKPKDFDISTSALPEEIKAIFRRNCILIGRRFRLAHIRFGRKIFEVSTFRAGNIESNQLIIQDNEWGTPEEDVLRRDFTINGMFYDPADHSVIDYVGGWEDIHKALLRTIGNPHARFNQDPVRMIRLLKFQARIGFTVDPETLEALEKNKQIITKSSQARILEELLRMLESGAAEPFFKLLKKHSFLDMLLPWLTHFLEKDESKETYSFLSKADELNKNFRKSPLDRAVMICCLLFPLLQKEIEKQYLSQDKLPHLGELTDLVYSLIHAVVTSSFTHFPRRLTTATIAILTMQYRMTPLGNRRYHSSKILNRHDFPNALAFLKLRAMVDPSLAEEYDTWKEMYQQREQHIDHKPRPSRRRAPYRGHS